MGIPIVEVILGGIRDRRARGVLNRPEGSCGGAGKLGCDAIQRSSQLELGQLCLGSAWEISRWLLIR